MQEIQSALGMSAYLITRYDDVKDALADPQRFANRKPRGWGPGGPEVTAEEYASITAGNLLGTDPPEHQRLRRMLTPEFRLRACRDRRSVTPRRT